MPRFLKKLICFSLIFFPLLLTAQEAAKTSGTAPISSRAQRKSDKKKWKEQRRKDKLDKKVVKQHHKRIQTKKVRKRMRKEKKRAQRNNDHQREFFLKRWFSPKQR